MMLLFVSPAVFAADLPSWWPSGYAVTDLKYFPYTDSQMFIDKTTLPKNEGGYALIDGKQWHFYVVPPQKNADCGKIVYPALKQQLLREGFRNVHEDWILQKGEGENAQYVHFGGGCNITIAAPAPNPFRVTLKAPAATPEVFGKKDDIPYLSPIPAARSYQEKTTSPDRGRSRLA